MEIPLHFVAGFFLPLGMESFTNHLLNKINEDFALRFRSSISQHIQKTLAFIGISFETEHDFIKFTEKRITRVLDERLVSFYLDYVDNDNCGLLLGSFSDEPVYTWNNDHTMITAELNIYS